jgi:hypothetical protein
MPCPLCPGSLQSVYLLHSCVFHTTWCPTVLVLAAPLQISLTAIREGAADLLVQLLTVASPEIRAAAVFGLGCLVHSGPGPTLDGPQVGALGDVHT